MTTVPPAPIKSSTTPFQTINPASVTTKDGSLKRVMMRPWPMPIMLTSGQRGGNSKRPRPAIGRLEGAAS